ncbi:HEAT repeat domain-containing protein [Natrinema soli]|uniref:HEAT repeat domain-containing protein n=1 Tax=Natrinema soli TaxID=1930624 RepID=A0ABD5SEW7_9EURY|nr:HEAT repeat domain-containing protein [Natrinema soli]
MAGPSEDEIEHASALQEAAKTEPSSVDVDDVVDLLVDGDQQTRSIAFEAFTELAAVRSAAVDATVARLEEHLTTDVTDIRRRAVLTTEALVERHPEPFERVVPELRAIADDRSTPGREPAILALAKLALERPTAVVPAVDSLLAICHEPVIPVDDSTPDGIPDAGPHRGAALKQERKNRDEVRVHAIAGLTRIAAADPATIRGSVSDVADLLEDDNTLVRAGACEVLEAIALEFPREVEPFVSALATRIASDGKHPVPWRAADTLVAVGDACPERVGHAVAPIVDDLSKFVESRNAERRTNGITLLADAANAQPKAVESMIPKLRARLEDDDPSVRANAALALGFAGDVTAYATIAELAESDPNADVRDAADRSLDRLRRTEATDG